MGLHLTGLDAESTLRYTPVRKTQAEVGYMRVLALVTLVTAALQVGCAKTVYRHAPRLLRHDAKRLGLCVVLASTLMLISILA